MLTCPPRQAAVAPERVLVILTACSHWSMRTESIRAVWHRMWSAILLQDSARSGDAGRDGARHRVVLTVSSSHAQTWNGNRDGRREGQRVPDTRIASSA